MIAVVTLQPASYLPPGRRAVFFDPQSSWNECAPPRRDTKMTTIAIVDDDPSIRRSVSRLLRSHSFECIAYDSAEKALADSELRKIGCLLIDIELLDMSGFALRDRLRDLGSSIPHIFVTAHSESDFPDWHEDIGDSYCLAKPVDENLLLSAINVQLSKLSVVAHHAQ
jgi:FixJ family two-component response regulator